MVILKCFRKDTTLHRSFISVKLFYMFRAVSAPIFRNTHNCIYSIWYLINRYFYMSLFWMSWSWFEGDVEIVLICFGMVADVSKINTISTSHSKQQKLIQK